MTLERKRIQSTSYTHIRINKYTHLHSYAHTQTFIHIRHVVHAISKAIRARTHEKAQRLLLSDIRNFIQRRITTYIFHLIEAQHLISNWKRQDLNYIKDAKRFYPHIHIAIKAKRREKEKGKRGKKSILPRIGGRRYVNFLPIDH